MFLCCVLRFCAAFSRLKLTPSTVYNQEFLKPTVLQPVVLKKGLLQPGVLTTTGLTTKGSYDQRFLQPEVPTTRGSYNQGFLQQY